MTAVAGLRGTGDWATDERPKNFRELILFRNPNGSAPLTALMARLKQESTNDPEFAWWDEPNDIIRLQMSALAATTDTSFTVDTVDPSTTNPGNVYGEADHLKRGDILLVEPATEGDPYAAELVMVTSVTNSTAFNVTRGVAGTTAATIADNAFLTKIGSAFSEGSGAPAAASRNPIKYFNYTQIFKTIYDITGTAKETKTRTGDPLRNDKRRKMFDHSVDLEMGFLFGRKHETTTTDSGKPLRYTGGLREFIPANRTTIFSTSPTVDTFLTAVYPVFDYDTGAGNERLLLCGNGFLNNLNKLVRDQAATSMELGPVIRTYGMALREYRVPQGSFFIRTHPLMSRHGRYTNSAFVVDPTALVYRFMKNRDTKFKDNIQLPDEDREKGMWITEAGLEVQYGGQTMAYIGNFTI